ncbi:Replication factor C subunit 3 [Smittium culicis]|uniref:Replication factor C subunit 3 n=1 Tax=Smittium culicis TaxID=133412 RepID=A0A1R1Y883_9FUNG|nr:Replication factor C subunit 3 [Smittium culicis]OMJ23167.1 Replication factor C subunit 3 [Smittium culicis]
MYGIHSKNMVMELNASDDRGIDVVREQIKNFASTSSGFGSSMLSSSSSQKSGPSFGFKLIVLDEADSMTQQAQAALRRVIEKYTKNVRFCIVCNYSSKIIPAIQSRCTRFRFQPLLKDQVLARMEDIIASESVDITADAKQAILDLSGGDMRRVLNILQACYLSYAHIDAQAVYNCTGQPRPEDIQKILDSLGNDEFKTCYDYILKIKHLRGIALSDIITCLSDLIHLIEYPDTAKAYIASSLADIEYRLSNGATENVQLTALISAFKLGINLAAPSA